MAVGTRGAGVNKLCLLDDQATIDSDGDVEGILTGCGSPHVLRDLNEGFHQLAVVAIDAHDNLAADLVEFTVDLTAPDIAISGVEDGDVVPVDGPPREPSCSATDALSGLAAPCAGELVVPDSGVGTHRYVASATDRAGNTAILEVTWQVVFPFDGSDRFGTTTTAKAGSSLPITFGLGGDRGLGVLAEGSPRSVRVDCNSFGEPVAELTPTEQPGERSLTYAAGSAEYQYVWKSDKSWAGTCRMFVLELIDETTHSLAVRFR